MSIEIMSILNDSFITQVYTSYLDLASFSRRVSAREPCGQFWDENEKLCRALASILLGSRCPEKHSIESKPIGTIFALGITFHSAGRPTPFWSQSIIYKRLIGRKGSLAFDPWPRRRWSGPTATGLFTREERTCPRFCLVLLCRFCPVKTLAVVGGLCSVE